ncbi:MAG: response regulator transcription factor [Gemmatimonadaceae bacterium]
MRPSPTPNAGNEQPITDLLRHPLVHALETFAVPFFCYASDGRRTHTSSAAQQLARSGTLGLTVGQQADLVAAEALRRPPSGSRQRQFAVVRELPAWHNGVTLAVHLACPVLEKISAVVVAQARVRESSANEVISGLTMRESEVAYLIAAGLATKGIAFRLGISQHTARHHTERVFSKLGIHSRAGIASLVGRQLGRSSHMTVVAGTGY